MPAITSLVALAGVAASVGGVITANIEAKKQAAAAKKQADDAKAALQAKEPSEDTEAKIKLAQKDKDLKRGKGSLAKRNRAASVGGLPAQSASEVGGL